MLIAVAAPCFGSIVTLAVTMVFVLPTRVLVRIQHSVRVLKTDNNICAHYLYYLIHTKVLINLVPIPEFVACSRPISSAKASATAIEPACQEEWEGPVVVNVCEKSVTCLLTPLACG